MEIKFQHMEGRYCVKSLIGIREGKSLMEKKSYTSPPHQQTNCDVQFQGFKVIM